MQTQEMDQLHPPLGQTVAINDLVAGNSARLEQLDPEHVRVLAERFDALPPILVHAETNTIIDGFHRVHAARMAGHKFIGARLFHGTDSDAFVESVRMNITHGKPLTLAERQRAATRILQLHPEWADKRISEICGLAPRTVATARASTLSVEKQPLGRLGRDGRWRPLDPSQARVRVAEILRSNPHASLREVAAMAKTSQATVLDVRRRIERGESPAIERTMTSQKVEPSESVHGSTRPAPASRKEGSDFVTREAFRRSPNLESFARWFDQHDVNLNDVVRFAGEVPVGRIYEVIDESRRRQTVWDEFVRLLEGRTRATAAG